MKDNQWKDAEESEIYFERQQFPYHEVFNDLKRKKGKGEKEHEKPNLNK